MDLEIVTLAERPDLVERIWDFDEGVWHAFMWEDPTAPLYYTDCVRAYPEFVMVALDGDEVVARSFTVPFHWDADRHGPVPDNLPDGGWDWVIRRSVATRLAGTTPNLVSALEITIQLPRRGCGIAAPMLDAMRRNIARLGYADLVAPVRPNAKSRYPDEPMTDYVKRVRPDGLPEDPWLRVHVRAGGRIVRTAPSSMTINGTLADWRKWTGLPFDTDGPVHVEGALVPVQCDVTHGYAVYVEPNVWVHHRLTH